MRKGESDRLRREQGGVGVVGGRRRMGGNGRREKGVIVKERHPLTFLPYALSGVPLQRESLTRWRPVSRKSCPE